MAETINEGDMVKGSALGGKYGIVRTITGAYAVVISTGRTITCKLADLAAVAQAHRQGAPE